MTKSNEGLQAKLNEYLNLHLDALRLQIPWFPTPKGKLEKKRIETEEEERKNGGNDDETT